MDAKKELLKLKTQKMIDGILRHGGNSVRCNDLECELDDVVDLYEKRGWRVSKRDNEDEDSSFLLFETASERKLLKG